MRDAIDVLKDALDWFANLENLKKKDNKKYKKEYIRRYFNMLVKMAQFCRRSETEKDLMESKTRIDLFFESKTRIDLFFQSINSFLDSLQEKSELYLELKEDLKDYRKESDFIYIFEEINNKKLKW